MGYTFSKCDCTRGCDDDDVAQFRQPVPFNPKFGFTFAAPGEGAKMVLGASAPSYYPPPPAPRAASPSPSASPPRVPVVPLHDALTPIALPSASSTPAKTNDTIDQPSPLTACVAAPSTTAASGGSAGLSGGPNGGGSKSREPFADDDDEQPKEVGGSSSHHHQKSIEGDSNSNKGRTPEGKQNGNEGAEVEKILARARTLRVVGGSNYVHMMAFTAQYVVPAVHGPTLRFSVRNGCHASLAIGVVPLAHAAQLYGPNRYLYDWRSPDICGGGVTLWAHDLATPFGIFDFPRGAVKGPHSDLFGLCVKESVVTLELDVAARLVRLSVRLDAGGGGKEEEGVREIVGSIQPGVISLDTPLIFVVAPMFKGDVVTILPLVVGR